MYNGINNTRERQMPSLDLHIDVKKEAFECPTCGYPSQQHRYSCFVKKFGQMTGIDESLKNPLTNKKNSPIMQGRMGLINCTECEVCGFIALWINNNLIFPTFPKNISKPNQDMPQEIKDIYIEAAEVSHRSPRSAAALLRLCLEMLLDHLNITGNDTNEKIGNSNFPDKILKACDAVRVRGNDAVHAREIQFNDTAETVSTLFHLINYIIEMQITLPNKADEVFNTLTVSQKNQIKERNEKNKKS